MKAIKGKEAHITLHQWSPKVQPQPSSGTCGVIKGEEEGFFFPPRNIILQTNPPQWQPEAYKDTIPAVYFKHVCKNSLACCPLWGWGLERWPGTVHYWLYKKRQSPWRPHSQHVWTCGPLWAAADFYSCSELEGAVRRMKGDKERACQTPRPSSQPRPSCPSLQPPSQPLQGSKWDKLFWVIHFARCDSLPPILLRTLNHTGWYRKKSWWLWWWWGD